MDIAPFDEANRAQAYLVAIARRELAQIVDSLDLSAPDTARAQLLEYVPALVRKYGNMAATIEAAMYEELRARYVIGRYSAVVADAYPDESTAKLVERACRGLADGVDPRPLLNQFVDLAVRQPARETLSLNARRDPSKPKWARVPSGGHTCAFCLMLASRGFVYANKRTAGDMNRYHAGCTCRVVCSWEERPEVEGYDPDEYLKLYARARDEAGTAEEGAVLAAMRAQTGRS